MWIDLTNKETAFVGKEDLLQREVATMIKKTLLAAGLPQLFFHCPNEGMHKPQYRMKMKVNGVKAGVPDCIALIPRLGYHGLLIELKTVIKGRLGEPSQEQCKFMADAASQGYAVYLISDFPTAEKIVTEYLK